MYIYNVYNTIELFVCLYVYVIIIIVIIIIITHYYIFIIIVIVIILIIYTYLYITSTLAFFRVLGVSSDRRPRSPPGQRAPPIAPSRPPLNPESCREWPGREVNAWLDARYIIICIVLFIIYICNIYYILYIYIYYK